jgi:hypothetical protein
MKLKYLFIALCLFFSIFYSAVNHSDKEGDSSLPSDLDVSRRLDMGINKNDASSDSYSDSYIWFVCIIKESRDRACCCLPDCCFPCLPPNAQQIK